MDIGQLSGFGLSPPLYYKNVTSLSVNSLTPHLRWEGSWAICFCATSFFITAGKRFFTGIEYKSYFQIQKTKKRWAGKCCCFFVFFFYITSKQGVVIDWKIEKRWYSLPCLDFTIIKEHLLILKLSARHWLGLLLMRQWNVSGWCRLAKNKSEQANKFEIWTVVTVKPYFHFPKSLTSLFSSRKDY